MTSDFYNPEAFSALLYEKMIQIDAGIEALELYEFRYCLNNLYPKTGWRSVKLESRDEIEKRVNDVALYHSIQLKPRVDDRIVLDEPIVHLANMLFVGLVTDEYPVEWIRSHFYFDVRSFLFMHRTVYFSGQVLAHLGGKPFRQFELKQAAFERCQDVGYKAFREANAEVDALFFESVQKLIRARGTPILLAIAGPTAAGKTEIVERLRDIFRSSGKKVTTIEMDNFLTDREPREAKGIFTQGKEALHFELLKHSLEDILLGKAVSIPRYDFVFATSSHSQDGKLRPGGRPIVIEPADIIFIEGNFPFLYDEISRLIGIKVVYLTDDPVRLKRKWKRDIDYRKKYEPTYFRNRYFKDQFIMAEIAYRPQMAACDMVVDTSGAALWITPAIAGMIHKL
jgi:uridine kinase